MFIYRLFYMQSGLREIQNTEIKGRLLKDALNRFAKDCRKQDRTGIFFPLEACLPAMRADRRFHIVNVEGELLGILLEGLELLELISPGRNRYLLALRAKRELYGLTLPAMAQMTGDADYKDQESGHRKMLLDDYARYMLVLDDYAEEGREGS